MALVAEKQAQARVAAHQKDKNSLTFPLLFTDL